MNKSLNTFLNIDKIKIVLDSHDEEQCFLLIYINDELISKSQEPELFNGTPNDRDLSAYKYLVENKYLPYRVFETFKEKNISIAGWGWIERNEDPLYLESYCRDHNIKFSNVWRKCITSGFKHQR